MFALYYEHEDGHLSWIAACHDGRSARNLAQIYSSGSIDPVVCIYNDQSGTTRRYGAFRDGREIEGSPLPPAAVDSRPQDGKLH